MSKKMMKRSLALGALMAFVITGSAMAAELTINYDNGTYTATGDGIEGSVTANTQSNLFNGLQGWCSLTDNNKRYTIAPTADLSDSIITVKNARLTGVEETLVKIKGAVIVKTDTSGTATNNNAIVIDGSNISHQIAAADNRGTGEAKNNVVTIKNESVVGGDGKASIYGAIVGTGNAENNKVEIIDSKNKSTAVNYYGIIGAGVYSSYIESNALIKNNEVLVNNSEVSGMIWGGVSNQNNVDGNKVVITDGSVCSGEIFGGNTLDGVALNNEVMITDSEITSTIYGGCSEAGSDVKANKVIINSGNIGSTSNNTSVLGGLSLVKDSEEFSDKTPEKTDVTLNEVIVNGGTINSKIYGGKSDDGKVNENTVTIAGGSINKDVYGGYVTKGEANNNTVTISGSANLTNASLFGSNLTTSTGNTLNIGEGWSGSAQSVQNFNTVNFAKGSAITVTNAMTLGSGATINLVDGNDYTGSNYAINGNLVVNSDTATLTIGSIKETTYNIAGTYSDADTNWTLDNDLMEVDKWNTDGQLQVTVKAQSASDIANNLGVSESTGNLLNGIITAENSNEEAVQFVENIMNSGADDEVVQGTLNAMEKMAEAGGQSATAARIVNNVTNVTNNRLSFSCGHSAPHKGGHGVGLFEEGSGADVWVQYVHGKDKVEDMPSTAGASSYEGQYNGIVMGMDFKKVNKFQSGVAFNYGEGDTNSVGSVARTHSDYDFWGIGYYGNIHNDDSNVIFDISYAKTDSDVTQNSIGGVLEASPETTTWSAGVKVEKLYQNEDVQIVPYTGLRYMSIDTDDYATKGGGFMYNMDRQDIWLLPLGVSIKQEVANDNGWTVSPKVDLSYIWAFGDTNSNMEVKSGNGISPIGYDVMDDGSFLGVVGIEAHKDQWGFGVSYSYQKGDHSESKKWYVNANYSF